MCSVSCCLCSKNVRRQRTQWSTSNRANGNLWFRLSDGQFRRRLMLFSATECDPSKILVRGRRRRIRGRKRGRFRLFRKKEGEQRDKRGKKREGETEGGREGEGGEAASVSDWGVRTANRVSITFIFKKWRKARARMRLHQFKGTEKIEKENEETIEGGILTASARRCHDVSRARGACSKRKKEMRFAGI